MIRSATGGLGLGRLGRCRATHLLSIRRSIGGSARVRIEQQQQQQLKSAASQPAPWSRLLVRSALLGGTAGGVYRVTRPINEDGTDPAYIARMPGWQQLPMRAYHRLMSVYKGIADPDVHDLLPDPFPVDSPYYRPKTLVVELDNVLVHSEYDRDQGWSVAKRPWADYFLAHMCRYYEIVVFTRQTSTYAQPIIAKLDNQMGTVLYQLYDDSTVYDIESGEQLKDLSVCRIIAVLVEWSVNSCHYSDHQILYYHAPLTSQRCSTATQRT